MSLLTLPPDDLKRLLTVAQPDNLPHLGLVGDTYTITVTGEQTAGRFCAIDMHIAPAGQEKFFMEVGAPVATRTTPPPKLNEKEQAAFIENLKVLAPKYKTELLRQA